MADLLAAISVLLVFLTLLLGGLQTDSEVLLSSIIPLKNRQDEYTKFRTKVYWQIFKSFVITLTFFLIFWTLLPRTVEILKISKFDSWNFDELPTIFVLIETGILGMFIFGLLYVIKLTAFLYKN